MKEFDNIEIEEDIKVKTEYFFRWCKFVKQARNVKYFRIEEVENIRRSICFHGHSAKYNSFMTWKKYTNQSKRDKFATLKIHSQLRRANAKRLIQTLKATK